MYQFLFGYGNRWVTLIPFLWPHQPSSILSGRATVCSGYRLMLFLLLDSHYNFFQKMLKSSLRQYQFLCLKYYSELPVTYWCGTSAYLRIIKVAGLCQVHWSHRTWNSSSSGRSIKEFFAYRQPFNSCCDRGIVMGFMLYHFFTI